MKKKVIGIIAAIVVVLGLSLVVYNQIIPNEYVPAADEIALHLQLDTEEDIGLLVYDYRADSHEYSGGISNADGSLRRVFFMNIEAKELSKIYGSGESQVVALDHANLKIASSDFISIMGPSGSGKSTLLHLLSGLDRPTSGSLTYDGKDIYSYGDKELSAFRRKRIGFIFQQFNLLPVLTAKENIIMPLLLDKKQPDEAYLKQITELLNIQGRLEHLPHELSGGQQQRVAIARALIAKPDVIFADEPTGNLDSKSGGEVMELLQGIWKEMGKTLVVITHDSRIARMAERQFQIVDGILSEVNVK